MDITPEPSTEQRSINSSDNTQQPAQTQIFVPGTPVFEDQNTVRTLPEQTQTKSTSVHLHDDASNENGEWLPSSDNSARPRPTQATEPATPELDEEISSNDTRQGLAASAHDLNGILGKGSSLETEALQDLNNGTEPEASLGPLARASTNEARLHDPSRDYESQGVRTLLEEAVDESPRRTLLPHSSDVEIDSFIISSSNDGQTSVEGAAPEELSSILDPDTVKEIQAIEGSSEQARTVTEDATSDSDAFTQDHVSNSRSVGDIVDNRKPSEELDSSVRGFTSDVRAPFDIARDDTHSPSKLSKLSFSEVDSLAASGMPPGLTDENFPDVPRPDSREQASTPVIPDDLAALWSAALGDEEFVEDSKPTETPNFFLDDGAGFLEDEQNVQSFENDPNSISFASAAGAEVKREDARTIARHIPYQHPVQEMYMPSDTRPLLREQPSKYEPSRLHFIQEGQDTRTLTSPYPPYAQQSPYQSQPSYFQQPKRPAPLVKAESFADKSKGGYSSPYDLPSDISQPAIRRRVGTQPFASGTNHGHQSAPPAAPPRSSSVPSKQQTPDSSRLQSSPFNPSMRDVSGASLNHLTKAPPSGRISSESGLPFTSQQLKSASNEFFAELPVVVKPRTPAPGGWYAPHADGAKPPLPTPLMSGGPPLPREVPTQHTLPHFQPPQQLNLFPGQVSSSASVTPVTSAMHTTAQAPLIAPSTSVRYSPAQRGSAPPTGQRYSPAPPVPDPSAAIRQYAASTTNAAPPPSHTHAFAPRTSSPLAHHQRSRPSQDSEVRWSAIQAEDGQVTAPVADSMHMHGPIASPPGTESGASQPRRAKSDYAFQTRPRTPSPDRGYAVPTRPKTQSPSYSVKRSMLDTAAKDRPVSVHGPSSPTFGSVPQGSTQNTLQRSISAQSFEYIEPADDTAADPLQRWKGQPIFVWGFGGVVLSSLPKHIPRYAMGQSKPMIRCSPGEVRLRNAREILPLNERFAEFPGPLRSKAKKKDVIVWLSARIEDLDRAIEATPLDMRMQAEEKAILWKAVRVLVEHDGVLEGNLTVDKAVRQMLGLESRAAIGATSAPVIDGHMLDGVQSSASSSIQAESIDPRAIDELRTLLLRGEREKAVWHAADHRLWAHALLISTTLGQDIWKRLVHDFVRQEVKRIGFNSEPLAALYEIFAGNSEDSIDHLVPPSARAGHQMVSTAGPIGASRNSLAGLDRWRETLALIVGNRSTGDTAALTAMGKLLAGYGRTAAAHVCFLFARSSAHFGGADDPQANFQLLGVDRSGVSSIHENIDAILLSEVYEFASSLSAQSTFIPHLQAYKLHHALKLAECGYRSEAQQYCEAINAAIKSTTRPSPYYNSSLVAALEDLTRRMSQSPKDNSSSWFPRPTAGMVSGMLGARFNKFIAGDESNDGAALSVKGGDEAGPFARISGETPAVSRSTSAVDLSSAFPQSALTRTVSSSRYAPSGPYAPQNMQQQQPQQTIPFRSRHDSQSSPSFQSRPSMDSSRSVSDFNRGSGTTYKSVRPTQRQASGYETKRQSSSYQPYANANLQPEIHPSQQLPQLGDPGSRLPAGAQRGLADTGQSQHSFLQPDSGSIADIGYGESATQQSVFQRPQLHGISETTPEESLARAQEPFENFDGPLSDREYPRSSYEHAQSTFQPVTSSDEVPTYGCEPPASSYQPSTSAYEPPTSAYQPPTSTYEPQASTYDPSATELQPAFVDDDQAPQGGYQPPSYEPYVPADSAADDDSPTREKRNGSLMDDDADDDLARKASELKKQERSAKDQAADEAFRKAVEVDAARDGAGSGEKKGWFGGWFGGKKDPNAAPGPIKAKLGEESSFYYDPELKKWVNKKGGPAAQSPTSIPLPPKAAPPRSATNSAMGLRPPTAAGSNVAPNALPPAPAAAPSSRPPSRNVTPAFNELPTQLPGVPAAPPTAMSPADGGALHVGPAAPSSAPPSRPATSMSNASSIDDLLGPAVPRKGGTMKKGKKGRGYVDVMAKEDS